MFLAMSCGVQHALSGKFNSCLGCAVHSQVGIMGDVRSKLILHYFTLSTKLKLTPLNQIRSDVVKSYPSPDEAYYLSVNANLVWNI